MKVQGPINIKILKQSKIHIQEKADHEQLLLLSQFDQHPPFHELLSEMDYYLGYQPLLQALAEDLDHNPKF